MVFSFLVPCGTTPLFMNVCFILSDSLLHHWVLEKDISVLHFLYFVVPLLSCLNPTLAVLHVPRIPGLWQPLGIPAQFFYWILLDFLMAFFARNMNINRALMLILLAAWIGPSLLLMEWAFLWNFGLQHFLTPTIILFCVLGTRTNVISESFGGWSITLFILISFF